MDFISNLGQRIRYTAQRAAGTHLSYENMFENDDIASRIGLIILRLYNEAFPPNEQVKKFVKQNIEEGVIEAHGSQPGRIGRLRFDANVEELTLALTEDMKEQKRWLTFHNPDKLIYDILFKDKILASLIQEYIFAWSFGLRNSNSRAYVHSIIRDRATLLFNYSDALEMIQVENMVSYLTNLLFVNEDERQRWINYHNLPFSLSRRTLDEFL